MSDAPTNKFLIEFGIDEKSTHVLTRRVTHIIAKNLKISGEEGSDVLRCDLDKSACVRDIVQYIECEDLTIIDAQWMFFAFGATIADYGRLRAIAQSKYATRRMLTAMGEPFKKFVIRIPH